MYFWWRLFYLILFLDIAVMESPDFEFHNTVLGHSGLLIAWERKEIQHNDAGKYFKFGHRIKDSQKNTNFSFSNLTETSDAQYKIHSLKENTLYDIIIHQYASDNETSLENKYSFVIRTNRKTNSKPAKPNFTYSNAPFLVNNKRIPFYEYTPSLSKKITWLPCGEERNCNGVEAGTHFHIKLKALDERGECLIEEYDRAFRYIYISSGIIYEVSVISINEDAQSESDVQEIFEQPGIGPIKSPKLILYDKPKNTEIVLSWKSPEHFVDSNEKLQAYEIIVANDSCLINCQKPYRIPFTDSIGGRDGSMTSEAHFRGFRGISNFYRVSRGTMDWPDREYIHITVSENQLEPGATYIFSITPIGMFHSGLVTRVKYTIPVKKDD